MGERQVVRRGLGGDPHAARLGLGDRLDRLARGQVLDVDPALLVAGDRGVAGDHRRLGDRRDAGQPEPRGDLALVHHAGARQARVLLVQREHAAAQPLVLQRLAQDRGAVDRLAVVGEAERAGVGQLGHLGQRVAREPARDRGEEADRDPRLAPRGLAQRAQHGRVVDDRVGVRHRDDGDEAAGRGGAGAASRGPPCAPGRARAGARAGRRSRAAGGGPRRRSPRRPPGASRLPGAPSSAISPSRTSTSCGASIPARGSSTWAARISRSAGGCSRCTSGSAPRGTSGRAAFMPSPARGRARSARRAARRAPPSARRRRPRPAGRSPPAASRSPRRRARRRG